LYLTFQLTLSILKRSILTKENQSTWWGTSYYERPDPIQSYSFIQANDLPFQSFGQRLSHYESRNAPNVHVDSSKTSEAFKGGPVQKNKSKFARDGIELARSNGKGGST
jgi:hypothetical protein